MARKSVRTGLETEIERTRWEERWQNIPKLAEQLSNRTTSEPHIDVLKDFLNGEAQLEIYLQEHSLGSIDLSAAKKDLQSVVDTLNKIVTKDKDKKGDYAQESLLQLCKAHFVLEDFQSVVKCCNEAQVDDLAMDLMSRRKAKMVAEALAYKAMALEQLQSSGQSGISDSDIIYFYESAGDIAMWIMTDQGLSTQRGVTSPIAGDLGQALEVAIQRAPILLIKNGKISKGIFRFRSLLQTVEAKATYTLRKALAKQLAHVLLYGMCEKAYERVTYQGPSVSASSLSLKSINTAPTSASINITSSKRTSFPLKPRVHTGEGLFIPRDEMEETLLLLLLEEAMVLKDSELRHSPEHETARRRCVADANSVYDLLTIALLRRHQYGMLTECLDRGMKLAFEEFHLWFQFGLTLISAGKYSRALLVLKQCIQLKPQDAMVPLYAAKLCFNNLHMITEGIEFAQKVVSLGAENEMASKGYLALGLGYSLQASETSLRSERQQLQKQAIEALKRAHELDKNDSEILFHLSLNQSIIRQISKAQRNVRSCLKQDGNNVSSLHLLALILSAQKKFSEALEVCEAALLEFPEDFGLLLTKVKLEEVCVGGEQALVTCKRLLETWKLVYDSDLSGSMEFMIRRAGSGLLDKVVADNRSLKQIPLTEFGSEKDSGDASSIAASVRIEQTLSEEALTANTGRLSLPAALALQAKLWLAIAEVYVALGKDAEASACVLEATLIFPLSPDVLFQRGQTCEVRGNLNEAKTCYENAIAINPCHVSSLQRLGVVYQESGNLTMAEKVLREAVNIEPTSHTTWHNLGVVLEALGEHEAASECLLTAVDLEATCPIIPFTAIPRLL